jgi:hypothetical protein
VLGALQCNARGGNQKPIAAAEGNGRRAVVAGLAVLAGASGTLLPMPAPAQTAETGGLLPSWNDGAAKQAIFDFVRTIIDRLKFSCACDHRLRMELRAGEGRSASLPELHSAPRPDGR